MRIFSTIAISACMLASDAFSQPPNDQEEIRIKRSGAQDSQSTPAGNFTGAARIDSSLAELTDSVLYGDIWERPELSKRDWSLVTVASLIALNRPELRSHLRIARENGVMQEELIETITHLTFYTDWPNAVTAIGVARDVFGQR
jgi:alkylhydroperoxidase/carboxymuconolactone decarboxylase family protein YurZ